MEASSPSRAKRGSCSGHREPYYACVCYATSSVSLSLANKAVFSRHDFDFPLAVLATQAVATVALLRAGAALRLCEPVPFDRRLARSMLPVTVLFVSMLWTSGKALRYCSVPVVTIFKNLSVFGITAYERAVYGQRISAGVAASLVCMMAGSVVAAAGDLQFDGVGYTWMGLNVVCTVAYLAAVRRLQPTSSTAAKTFHNQLLALGVFAAAAAANGELPRYFRRVAWMPPRFQLGLLLSAVLGLLINLASFWCITVTSGTTYSFVGASNKIPAAILGHFLFSSGLNAVGWAGVAFGLAAGFGYAWSKLALDRSERLQLGSPQEARRAVADDVENGAAPSTSPLLPVSVAGGVARARGTLAPG